mgnify:CR=1 FL=1
MLFEFRASPELFIFFIGGHRRTPAYASELRRVNFSSFIILSDIDYWWAQKDSRLPPDCDPGFGG